MSFADSVIASREFNREVDATFRSLSRALVDYNEGDRKRITRKAAQKVAVAARRNTGFNDSKRPHFRDGGRVKINPGNLRRSLKVLGLRGSKDSFVGPQFAKTRASEYGKPGQPVDGYYAAMIYGSALAFFNRELLPALRRGRSAALKVLQDESNKAIQSRGVRRGLNIRR